MMLAEDILDDAIEAYAGKEIEPEDWDLDALKMDMSRVFGLDAGDYAGARFHRQERRMKSATRSGSASSRNTTRRKSSSAPRRCARSSAS